MSWSISFKLNECERQAIAKHRDAVMGLILLWRRLEDTRPEFKNIKSPERGYDTIRPYDRLDPPISLNMSSVTSLSSEDKYGCVRYAIKLRGIEFIKNFYEKVFNSKLNQHALPLLWDSWLVYTLYLRPREKSDPRDIRLALTEFPIKIDCWLPSEDLFDDIGAMKRFTYKGDEHAFDWCSLNIVHTADIIFSARFLNTLRSSILEYYNMSDNKSSL